MAPTQSFGSATFQSDNQLHYQLGQLIPVSSVTVRNSKLSQLNLLTISDAKHSDNSTW